MKKLLNVVLAFAMLLALASAACAQESLVVRDESEYASMSMDELYQAALKEAAEGKTLVVYSETGSVGKSVAQFMEDYPGIPAEGTKYKTNVIAEKIPLEFQGDPFVDVIITSDSSGSLYLDWYKKGYMTAYYPKSLESVLMPEFAYYGLPITLEADIWYYNTEAFPDGCPVTNWWDIVELKDDGTSVYTVITHPASNLNVAAMFANLVRHADLLEQAYEEKYGKPIEYTYPEDSGVEPNNAGYEWLYRFLQINHIENNDANEITAAVGLSTADAPVLGFTSSVKLGDALDLGQPVDIVRTMSHFNGFSRAKFVYMFTKSDSPAIAHLYALYAMGGEDGTGKGYDAYVNRMGCYPTRTDRDEMEFNKFSYADINVLPVDIEFVNYNYMDVQDFYTFYSEEFN